MDHGLQLGVFIILLLIVVPLLGRYMANIFQDRLNKRIPLLSNLESLTYRLCRVDVGQEMTWSDYAHAVVYFNLLGFLFLFFYNCCKGGFLSILKDF